tara:strand:- start:4523 stop:5173 length:651 start_codon:yes stop_codon:yes gene_type:complete
MSEYANFYRILGVPETAGEKEIKKKYRLLSMDYHPDRNPGNPINEERIRKINRAYSVLGDSLKRRQYDRNLARRKEKRANISLRPKNHNFWGHSSFLKSIFFQDKISNFRSLKSIKMDSLVEEFYNRGLAWQLIKNYKEARADYCRALSIAPKFGKAHLGLGEVYLKLGQKKRALQHLTLAKNLFSIRSDNKNMTNALNLLRNFSRNNDDENLTEN